MTTRTSAAGALEHAKQRLRTHPLYRSIATPADLRVFVESHVVCVLDFMSLLKSLQADLTCAGTPWVPRAVELAEAGRFVNEIVVDEESDRRADGRVQSHFAWYVEAMAELGADPAPILEVCESIHAGSDLAEALRRSRLPRAAREFGAFTARVLEQPLHVRAAVFFHGREDVIPSMFTAVVDELSRNGLACEGLREYLQRHIEGDGEDHGPRARALLDDLYGEDEERRREAEDAALAALGMRERLWDGIRSSLELVADSPAGSSDATSNRP